MSLEVTQDERREAPGPRSWPLIGNVGLLRGVLPFMEQQWVQHGDVFRVKVAGFRSLTVAHPELAQRVLISNRQNYVKGDIYNGTRRILGDGLLTLEGSRWKQRRTLAQPAFHRQALEKLAAIMVESGARFFDHLAQRLGGGTQVVDIHQEMIRLTLDVVVNALFGRGTLEQSQISYQAIGDTLSLISAGANGVQLPAWIPSPHNLKFQRTMRDLNANVYQVIAAARAHRTEGTLLSMLLDSRDEQGQPLSDRALRDEVVTLFIAGHETTALTLTWLFALLDQQPEIFARMHEEVAAALHGAEPSFADLPKLGFVRQVVDESLRLRPPAAMVARNALADDRLGAYAIAAGDAVVPFIWAIHRHPDFWNDPLRFDPERFTAAAIKGRHVASYLPFSAGPRICIGNTFSLIETTLLIAQLLRRFEVAVLPCTHVKPVAIGTVRPSKPVRVRLSRRAAAAS